MTNGFLNPEKVLGEISLEGKSKIADFGCGSGGWSIPLAKAIKEGQIYAIDILEEPLSALKSKAETERAYNIRCIRADLEKDSTLRDNSIDLVLLSNILFQAEDRKKMLKEASRVLRENGELLVVDWLEGTNVNPQEVENETEEAGFTKVKKIDAGVRHFAYLYKK